ncbi:hypothetical protein [Nocardia ninae]|uniref:hypothetical protein n=1 Tax=Nocardia ninae TaxID=356145 RepID=UPI0031E4893D
MGGRKRADAEPATTLILSCQGAATAESGTGLEDFHAMYYTPGWGALMTVVGTLTAGLGGVALTQLNQYRLFHTQASEQHRIEQRQTVQSVVEAGMSVVKAWKGFLNEAKKAAEDSSYPIIARSQFEDAGRDVIDSINGYRSAGTNALLVLTNMTIIEKVDAVQGQVETLEQLVYTIQGALHRDKKVAKVQWQQAQTLVASALSRELHVLITATANELKPS